MKNLIIIAVVLLMIACKKETITQNNPVNANELLNHTYSWHYIQSGDSDILTFNTNTISQVRIQQFNSISSTIAYSYSGTNDNFSISFGDIHFIDCYFDKNKNMHAYFVEVKKNTTLYFMR